MPETTKTSESAEPTKRGSLRSVDITAKVPTIHNNSYMKLHQKIQKLETWS